MYVTILREKHKLLKSQRTWTFVMHLTDSLLAGACAMLIRQPVSNRGNNVRPQDLKISDENVSELWFHQFFLKGCLKFLFERSKIQILSRIVNIKSAESLVIVITEYLLKL